MSAEQQNNPVGPGSGFSIGGTSIWKSFGEAREEKLQKLGTMIPQLIKQVEVHFAFVK